MLVEMEEKRRGVRRGEEGEKKASEKLRGTGKSETCESEVGLARRG